MWCSFVWKFSFCLLAKKLGWIRNGTRIRNFLKSRIREKIISYPQHTVFPHKFFRRKVFSQESFFLVVFFISFSMLTHYFYSNCSVCVELIILVLCSVSVRKSETEKIPKNTILKAYRNTRKSLKIWCWDTVAAWLK